MLNQKTWYKNYSTFIHHESREALKESDTSPAHPLIVSSSTNGVNTLLSDGYRTTPARFLGLKDLSHTGFSRIQLAVHILIIFFLSSSGRSRPTPRTEYRALASAGSSVTSRSPYNDFLSRIGRLEYTEPHGPLKCSCGEERDYLKDSGYYSIL